MCIYIYIYIYIHIYISTVPGHCSWQGISVPWPEGLSVQSVYQFSVPEKKMQVGWLSK